MGTLVKRIAYSVYDEVGYLVNKLARYCILCKKRSTESCDAAWWYDLPRHRHPGEKVYRLKRESDLTEEELLEMWDQGESVKLVPPEK